MAQFCKYREIRFMLVAMNAKAYVPDIERKYISIDPTFHSNFFDEDLEAYARSLYIDFLGLQRPFRASYKYHHNPLQWGHWHYMGHKVVANALTKKLEMMIPHNKRSGLNALSQE